MKKYDAVVIGGGPGGYVSAVRLAQSGKKTAVIEREKLGGICLNWGCIPTKSLLKNAEVISLLEKGDVFGFSFDRASLKIDYRAAYERSRAVSSRLASGVEFLMKKNGIDVIKAAAVFKDSRTIAAGDYGDISADNIIIAAGARPRLLPGVDYSDPRVMTSRNALEQTAAPKSVIIIGAGAIGMEFADIWHSYGASVTLVEMLEDVLPNEDREISSFMRDGLIKKGIAVLAGTRVEKVDCRRDAVYVTVSGKGRTRELSSEKVLISAGISPNTEHLGLDAAGVALERGYIKIDGDMRTNIPHIYAIGDITGKLALAHTASAQGIAAAAAVSGRPHAPVNYAGMPRCTYCTPEVASIGLTEEQAAREGYRVKTGRFPFKANGKALAMNEAEGFVKIVSDERFGEILGVHMAGPHVTELVSECAALMELEATCEEAAGVTHPHPTLSEALMEAVSDAADKAINI
jgi:dihydrolipoamide dehydrogenase